MQEAVLRFFPEGTHWLTVVSDPDGVLADETIRTELAERGFRVVEEEDPILLRLRLEQERPWTDERPLVVVTAGTVNSLPYDLWQQGQRVELALHAFFPDLSYPIVRPLTPEQRRRLSVASGPGKRLGEQATARYVLHHAFGADFEELRRPAGLIAWLNDYHRLGESMPAAIAGQVIASLRTEEAYRQWPLEELFESGEDFAQFVREQWRGYIQEETGRLLAEEPVAYILDFEGDHDLQDDLAGLLRTGTLDPIGVEEPGLLPAWARAGVLSSDEDARQRRVTALISGLDKRISPDLSGSHWSEWQAVGRDWAELNALVSESTTSGFLRSDEFEALSERLDAEFLAWLLRSYAPLGGDKAPVPHHVHHVPHLLARELRQRRTDRVALIVLDGLSMIDWKLIGPTWQARNGGWRFDERQLLAQLPTITAISRQALVSGLRPADFADTIDSVAAEPGLWRAFWAREDVAPAGCAFGRLSLDREETPAGPASTVRAICLIDHSIDEIVHGASLGAADVCASVRIWLERVSLHLEQVIDDLLERGFTVFVASDHGHVEARGMGQPSEGLAVLTRARRARIYKSAELAESARSAYKQTVLWGQDGLLPENLWALLPAGRMAFAPVGDTVVTHGGATLEEVMVPFVTIRKA